MLQAQSQQRYPTAKKITEIVNRNTKGKKKIMENL